jgi:hypothetical protein
VFNADNVPVSGTWVFAFSELLFVGDATNGNGIA